MSCLRFSNRGGFTCFLRAALLLGFFTAGGGEAWVQTWISAVGATRARNRGLVDYYVVTAVDSQGRESVYSNEIRAAIP
jgi:hypothetical protein